MRVSVFGIGYVGAVSAACLARDGHDLLAVDSNRAKVDTINAGESPIVEKGLAALVSQAVRAGRLRATTDAARAVAETSLSLVCVGTPSLPNGNLDLSQVRRVCEEIGCAIGRKHEYHAVVVRSTMLPGSMSGEVVPILEASSGRKLGEELGAAVYPEFLREGSAIRDYDEAGTVVIGTDDERSLALLRDLIGKVAERAIVLNTATAEMVKYANNAWHATKIDFANEVGAVCKQLGIDSHRIMVTLCADTRLNVSPTYMQPGFAFGGSCLPKDLRALMYKARSLDLQCPMLGSLLPSNEEQVRRAFDMVQAAGNRRVGLIGLAFKNGTDDLRESPAVELAERLFGKGYDVRIFDRNVSHARLMGSNLAFIQTRIPHLASLLRDELQEVVAHGDTLVLAHADLGEGCSLPAPRAGQRLIDLVRMPGAQQAAQGQYEGLCW